MTANSIISLFSFAVFAILWLGFAAALLLNPTTLDNVWSAFQSLPLLIQLVVGLVVLPVALGLWIWESPWPLWLRLLLVIGLAVATLYTFFPRHS